MLSPRIKNVQIATHSRCNANCVFCPYVESWHHDNPGVMAIDVWRRILSELNSPIVRPYISTGKICLYLMQEPLLDPLITQKMGEIYEAFPDITIELSTNGAALTPKRTEQIIEVVRHNQRKLDFWISHHGISSTTVDEIMRIDPSKATTNILTFIQRAHETLDSDYCTVVLRGAGFDFSRRIVYFTGLEYATYWDSLLQHHGISRNRQLLVYDYFGFHDRAGTIKRIERNANSLSYGVVRKIDTEHPLECARLTEWLHFMYDGSIVLCCMDYHREVSLPNIMHISLEDYFSSPQYQMLKAIFSGEQPSPSGFICTRCSQPTPAGLGRFRLNSSAIEEEFR